MSDFGSSRSAAPMVRRGGFALAGIGALSVLAGAFVASSLAMMVVGAVVAWVGLLAAFAVTPGGVLRSMSLPLFGVGLLGIMSIETTVTTEYYSGATSSSTDASGLVFGIPCLILALVCAAVGTVLRQRNVGWPRNLGAQLSQLGNTAHRTGTALGRTGSAFARSLQNGGVAGGPAGPATWPGAQPRPHLPRPAVVPPPPPPPPAVGVDGTTAAATVTAPVGPGELHERLLTVIGARPTPAGSEPVVHLVENRPGRIQVAFGASAQVPLFLVEVSIVPAGTGSTARFTTVSGHGETLDGLYARVRRDVPLLCPGAVVV
ncbi:hypothetical protein QNM97_22530 [Gordonia sp. L191]|uniref:hypothetical protein n=1 Tax=Gordonia sp. L191 TaxID=2982699 RepID=UPI0024BFB381|nr:hypothetical protein [Gordonia sp. L191]WHU46720.1 hypothetical protein QNM97_22530 [Gordonia sp. L191]